jgi:hypothetical protein
LAIITANGSKWATYKKYSNLKIRNPAGTFSKYALKFNIGGAVT